MYYPDLMNRLNDLVVVLGYTWDGECGYTDALFGGALDRAVQLWDKPEVARQFGLAKMRCLVFDRVGALVEEREYDFSPKRGPIVKIRSWDGTVRKSKLTRRVRRDDAPRSSAAG